MKPQAFSPQSSQKKIFEQAFQSAVWQDSHPLVWAARSLSLRLPKKLERLFKMINPANQMPDLPLLPTPRARAIETVYRQLARRSEGEGPGQGMRPEKGSLSGRRKGLMMAGLRLDGAEIRSLLVRIYCYITVAVAKDTNFRTFKTFRQTCRGQKTTSY